MPPRPVSWQRCPLQSLTSDVGYHAGVLDLGTIGGGNFDCPQGSRPHDVTLWIPVAQKISTGTLLSQSDHTLSYMIVYDYISDLQISKCQAHALHQIPLEALGPSAPQTFMEPWEDRGKPALLR